jgi:S-formylglutathione hydrolase FrmB
MLARLGLRTDRMAFHGYSMGGYGSLRLAPIVGRRAVRVVAVLSPAIWRDPADASTSGFADAAEYERYTVFGHQADLDGMAVRVDCGTDDPFYPEDRAYVAGFDRPVTATFRAGAHDTTYWARMMPAQLAFVGRRLGS